jgi:hypothetical protein
MPYAAFGDVTHSIMSKLMTLCSLYRMTAADACLYTRYGERL